MKDEMIIDVKEMCRRIIKKWKLLLVMALVGGLLANFAGYMISYGSYKKEQPVSEEKLEKYKSKLSEKELEVAEQTYDMYEIYKKQYESELEYNKNSVLMKIGTDNVATVELQYYIDNHYQSVYPVIDQINNVTDIIEAYSLHLTGADVMEKIKESTGTEIAERYLRELINVEPVADTQTMKITICTDSKKLTDGIADAIQQEVDSYTQNIQTQYGNFDIIGEIRSETSDIDAAIFALQQQNITSITTLRTQIDTVGNDLDDAQETYYNALINNSESSKEKFREEIVNKKYTLVGCVIGIFLAVFVVFLRYILQKELRNRNDLKDIYDCYTLGIIEKSEQDIDAIVDQIIAFAVSNGTYSVGLVGSDDTKETQEIFNRIASKIKENNLKIYVACGVKKIPKLLKELGQEGQVVLVEEKDKSTYKNIECEMEMCKKCDVKIVGNIIIDLQ